LESRFRTFVGRALQSFALRRPHAILANVGYLGLAAGSCRSEIGHSTHFEAESERQY